MCTSAAISLLGLSTNSPLSTRDSLHSALIIPCNHTHTHSSTSPVIRPVASSPDAQPRSWLLPPVAPEEFIKDNVHASLSLCARLCGSRWPVEYGKRWMERAEVQWSLVGRGHGGQDAESFIRGTLPYTNERKYNSPPTSVSTHALSHMHMQIHTLVLPKALTTHTLT